MASSLIESAEGRPWRNNRTRGTTVGRLPGGGPPVRLVRQGSRRISHPIRFTGREMDGTHSYGDNVHLFLKRGGGSLSVPFATRASTPVHTAGLLFPRSLSGRPPLLLPWLSSANEYIR